MKDRSLWARWWFALTAAAVVTGLVIQTVVVVTADEAIFDSNTGRIVNMLCYFTIQSNILVGVSTALLALDLDRPSMVFRVVRLTGVVAIAVTGVVYHVAISGLHELTGSAAVADQLTHTVVPLMAVGGWLVFGPRGLTSARVAWWTVAYPLAWGALALIRGPIVDFYPYTFVDVRDHGYVRVLVNMAIVGALFLGLAAGATTLDGRLARWFRYTSSKTRIEPE